MLDVHVRSCSLPLPLLLLLGDCSSGRRWTSKFATSCHPSHPAGNATNPSCYSSDSSCNSTNPSCNSSDHNCNSSNDNRNSSDHNCNSSNDNRNSSDHNCYASNYNGYSSRPARSTSSNCSRSISFHRSSSCPIWTDKQAKNERCHSRRRHRLRALHSGSLNFLPLQLHKKIEEDAVPKTADDIVDQKKAWIQHQHYITQKCRYVGSQGLAIHGIYL